jgi:hypothetical protein
MPEEPWDIVKHTYDLKCNDSAIFSYPYRDFIREPKLKSKRTPPHIVYAGGVIPYDLASERGGLACHIFDNLINLSGPDTFELTIYVNQNAREMPWHQQSHYFELEDKNKYFHFKKGLPYYEITNVLSQYDAGIFFDNIQIPSYNLKHFKYNVASKLFTYLEAGLPIIVYQEAEFMAQITRTCNLGAIYKGGQPPTILRAIDEICRNDYREKIIEFCRNFSMEIYANALMEAHNL